MERDSLEDLKNEIAEILQFSPLGKFFLYERNNLTTVEMCIEWLNTAVVTVVRHDSDVYFSCNRLIARVTNLAVLSINVERESNFYSVQDSNVLKRSLVFRRVITNPESVLPSIKNTIIAELIKILSDPSKKFSSVCYSVGSDNEVSVWRTLTLVRIEKALDEGETVEGFVERFLENVSNGVQDKELYRSSGSDPIHGVVYLDRTAFGIIFKDLRYRDTVVGGRGVFVYTDSDNFEVIDPPAIYGKADCFFSCISYLTKSLIWTTYYRIVWGLAPEDLITISHVKNFAELTGLDILILEDGIDSVIQRNELAERDPELKRSSDRPPYTVLLDTRKDGNVNALILVLVNGHYVVYRKERESQKIPGLYNRMFFYDYETRYSSGGGKIMPYAFSYLYVEYGVVERKGCIFVDDVYTGLRDVVLKILQSITFTNETVHMLGFNNGAFDDYLLLDSMLSDSEKLDGVIIDNYNKILTYNWKNLTSQDLYKFLPGFSLKRACEAFKVSEENTKGTLDHDEVQKAVFENKFREWVHNNEEKLVDYSTRDVMSLAELFGKFRLSLLKMGVEMKRSLSIAQLAKKRYMKHVNSIFVLRKGKYEKVLEPLGPGDDWRAENVVKFGKRTMRSLSPVDEGEIPYALKLPQLKTYDKWLIGDKLQAVIENGELVWVDYKRELSFQEILELSIVGGRAQVFNKGVHRNALAIDCVSLYPGVMMSRAFPHLLCPLGKNVDFEQYIDYVGPMSSEDIDYSKAGVYNVLIKKQPPCRIVPRRKPDGSLDWELKGEIKAWVDQNRLDCLRRYDGKFEVISGIVFNLPMGDIFSESLEKVKREKMIQDEYKKTKDVRYNEALRETCKLILNSLSGKMCEKALEAKKEIMFDGEKLDRFIEKYPDYGLSPILVEGIREAWLVEGGIPLEDRKIKSPTIIGLLIYSYAQTYMYDSVLYKITNKYGMDTDSLFFDANELPTLENATIKNVYGDTVPLFGEDFLQFKYDISVPCNIAIALKKVYVFFEEVDGERKVVAGKIRMKGVRTTDKLLTDGKLFECDTLIKRNDESKLLELYDSLPIAVTADSIIQLARGGEINILTRQIRRTASIYESANANIGLRFTYLIKKLKN